MVLEQIDEGVFAIYLGLKLTTPIDPKTFIEEVRRSSPATMVQAFDAKYCAGIDHLRAIVRESWMARKTGNSYAKKFELDFLLRVSCTLQIEDAIRDVGLKRGKMKVCLIGVGSKEELQKLEELSSQFGIPSEEVLERSKARESFLKKRFMVKDASLKATISTGGDKLGLLLAEKAALLSARR